MSVQRLAKKPPRDILGDMASPEDAPVNLIRREGQAQVTDLLQRVADLEKENERLRSQQDSPSLEAQSCIAELQSTVQKLTAELADMRQEKETMVATHATVTEELTKTLEKAHAETASLKKELAKKESSPKSISPENFYGFEPYAFDPDEWSRKVQSVANTYIKPLNARYDEAAARVLGELSHAFYSFSDVQADNGAYVRTAVALVHPLIKGVPYFKERLRMRILALRQHHSTPQGALPASIVERVLHEACMDVIEEQVALWNQALSWATASGKITKSK